MTGFLDLPPELARHIAPYIYKEDMNSLRLTCKQTNQHLFDSWVEAHFAEICLLPTTKALKKLYDISRNDKIRPSVRCITIWGSIYRQVDSWSTGITNSALPYNNQQTLATSGPLEHAPYNIQRCINDYVRSLRSGTIGSMLRRALQSFSGVEISVLYSPSEDMKDVPVWGRSELLRKTGLDPLSSDVEEQWWDTSGPTAQTLICSDVLMICSSLFITSLTLARIEPCYVDTLDMSPARTAECFASLKTLHIELDQCSDYTSLYRFLNALPSLEHLNYEFSGWDYDPLSLFQDVIVSSLVSLKLDLFYLSLRWSDLKHIARFLGHSARTLRSLSLNDIDGLGKQIRRVHTDFRVNNHWAKFLRQLRYEFQLDHLSIGVTAESQLSFLRIFDDGRELQHQRTKDTIRAQLDECIKHLELAVSGWPSGG